MEFGNVPGLHDLIQHLPLPLVLFGNGSDVKVANDLFAEVFEHGQLDSPDLRRLAQDPRGAWESVTLRHRDGRNLATAAKAVAVGDGVLLVFDAAAPPTMMKEIERLRERIAELESLSATDPLTGTWNRVHFERMVQVEMSRATRSGLPVTLILLDVDHFKQVNDDHGHLAGDAVLMEIVGRIRQRTRNSDSLFRWGGEEFLLLTTSVGYRGGAALAEDLRRAIASDPFAEVGSITISLGVAEYVEGESSTGWFQRVDQALYAAKSTGRNRVHVDRQGRSDFRASGSGTGVLRLHWLESYECGRPTIDAEHRELFDRGNALIATAIERHAEPGLWQAELESTLAHLGEHFRNEEALLSQHGYGRLAEHQRAHAGLLRQANELKAAVENGDATLGHLVNFLVNEVIALHILKIDRDFYPLFHGEDGAGAEAARA